MKILYVGTERAEAQAIATAVSSLGEGVSVSWTAGLDQVVSWIDANEGLRLLVVEAQPNGTVWRSVLTYTAGLPIALPVVVIVPGELASDQRFALDAHECVARDPSLLQDLPAAITRAIDRARERRLAAATRDMVHEQFREAAIEVDRARLRHASAVADAERLARREAELLAQLDSATSERGSLTAQLRKVEDARDQARREYQAAVADITRVTEREADLEERLKEERATRDTLEQTVADTAAALRDARQRHEVALKAAADELADRQAHFDGERAQAEAERGSLTAQLREVEEARDQARREHQAAVADITRLTERETNLEERLKEERATRDTLEQTVADTAAALRDAQQRHEIALKAAADELADRQAHFEGERAQAEAERGNLTAQLREVEEARDQARREHQAAVADITRLTEREADLEGRLKEERATRDTLEQTVASTAAALQNAQQQHEIALKAAADELADRQAHFEHERAQAEAERGSLTAQLREVEEARDQARREHQAAVADITRLTEREAELAESLKEERATRHTLEQTVASAAAALQDAQQRHEIALKATADELADRQAHFDGERAQAEAEWGSLAAQLREVEEARDQAGREHQAAVANISRLTEREADLEGRLKEERATRNTLEQTVADSAAALRDAEQRHEIALKAAADELAGRQADSERERAQAVADIAQLTEHTAAERKAQADAFEEQHREIERRFEEARSAFQESLKARVEQLGVTQHELDQSRADNHRLFQQAPLPMFRCTKDGVLTQTNRMLTILLGRRSNEELRGADLAAATFESPNDLSWLIERCLGSKGKESAETTWRRKDGSRLLVRLSARAISSDLIECGVEDLTPIRVLQDRLSQAHRMEAVGRLAAEVAVTCGNLLGSVRQNAEQWLATDGSHSASRHQADLLLEEISRAAGLLRQLAAYGDEESRKPAVVELRTVVRDVAPVLKRVAGDAVEVQLPAASGPLNVDAGAERVKRLLVNLAAYGRERMPFGGQLKIELGTIVVDRHFAAKHPNVRLGPHALVTVTESRRASRPNGPLRLHENEAGSSSKSVALQTGVDLGTVQELVAECGGHLWMTVEPVGDMVVKIRLPLVMPYGEPPRRTLAVGGPRTLAHWFQH